MNWNRRTILGVGGAALSVLVLGGLGTTRFVSTGDGSNDSASAAGENVAAENGDVVESSGSSSEDVPLKSDIECGRVPEPTLPPGFTPPPSGPLAEPENDFPIVFTIGAPKGDVGTLVEAKVVVPRSQALVVVVGRFFDGQPHGIQEAKFANAIGAAEFSFRIPESAPVGVAFFYASASHDQQSALTAQQFTVTGPGCP